AACSRPVPNGPQAVGTGIVQTLEDLRHQTALDLGEGVQARVGIETTQCELGSGVHLYCLTKGFVPPRMWRGRRLGPFQIRVAPQGTASPELECEELTKVEAAEENS